MTLQEKAFMLNLIRSAYRRRMWILFTTLTLVSSPFLAIYLLLHGDISSPAMLSLLAIGGTVGLLLFFFKYFIKTQTIRPWVIKREQMCDLETWGEDNFEALSSAPSLNEYFS